MGRRLQRLIEQRPEVGSRGVVLQAILKLHRQLSSARRAENLACITVAVQPNGYGLRPLAELRARGGRKEGGEEREGGERIEERGGGGE